MLTTLDERLPVILEQFGFSSLGPGGERHGAYEWAFLRKADALNRFVLIALTDEIGRLAVELWAGADDNVHFTRHLVSEFKISESDLEMAVVEGAFREQVASAVRAANAVRADELMGTYLKANKPEPV